MTQSKTEQKKEYAKILFLRENLYQKEIATKVGVTEKTVGKWIKEGDWEKFKASLIITKEQELRRVYMQITELNDVIFKRPAGERFVKGREGDDLSKLAATARSLETENSVSDIISVGFMFHDFVRKEDFVKAQEISALFDAFIKTKM